MIERITRAGATNIELVERPEKLNALTGKMDRVIIDAPCTGTGTWRRRPDIKWRLSESNLATRLNDQAKVLDAGSLYVRSGGRLIYITCSILPEENAAQVSAFLGRNAAFKAMPIAPLWQKLFGVEMDHHARISGQGIMLTPASMGTDGFYIAVLERI